MMKKVWISGEWSKEKRLHLRLTIWTCIYLSLVLAGKSVTAEAATALQVDRVNNAVQGEEVSDDAVLSSSSERTSNAIAEAEEAGFELFKKADKSLSKPYPYVKLQEPGSKKLDNSIQPSKRSDKDSASPAAVVDFNGTIFLSVSGPAESTESTDSTDLEKLTTPMSMPASVTSPATTTCLPDFSEDTTIYQDDAYVDVSSTPFITTVAEAETSPISSSSTTVGGDVASSEAETTEGETTFVTMHSSPVTATIKTTESTVNKETTATETTTAIPQDSSISTVTEEEETLPTTSATTAIIPVTSKTTETLSTTANSEATTPTPTTISNITKKTTVETMTPEASTTVPTTTMVPSTTMVPTMATTRTTAPFTLVPLLIPTTSQTDSETALMTSIESETATTAAATNLITLLTTASTTPATTMASSPLIITTSPKPTTPMSSETDLTTGTWQEKIVPSTSNAPPSTVPAEDATIFIRIVLEGGWEEICSKLPDLQQSLAELLNNNVDKKVSPSQIVFHQTQCSDSTTSISRSLLSEIPLTSVLLYVVDEKGRFDESLTKKLPRLYQMTPIDFPLTIHSFVILQDTDTGNAIAVVIVSCVAFICLILLAGLLFIMRKRQGRFNYGERCRPVSLDAYSLDSVSAYNSVRRSKNALRSSKRSYGNPTFEDSSAIPSHPLNFAGITSFCNDVNAVNDEFASIPQVSSKIDELPAGVDMKNRYANVIPLPETRVPLQMLNNDPTTEYINASYVRGPKNASKYYIACQAPTEQTVSDFWRMIWEQQCRVIIMLTDLVENGVEKCCEYIPPLEVSDCHRLYGDFQVTLKKREAKEKYAISTLHLKNLESNTFREVSHIWYLWPANGVPTDGAALIAVLLEARALQRGAAGPIVVHCSPGTGRTGTLIALDLGIRQYEITRTVDVPRVVYTIRRDRAGAVQTREQYLFIYKALNLYASKLAGGAIEASY